MEKSGINSYRGTEEKHANCLFEDIMSDLTFLMLDKRHLVLRFCVRSLIPLYIMVIIVFETIRITVVVVVMTKDVLGMGLFWPFFIIFSAVKDCKSGQFRCFDGSCIAMMWKCDREIDCHDGSDESDCGKFSTHHPPCSQTHYVPSRTMRKAYVS